MTCSHDLLSYLSPSSSGVLINSFNYLFTGEEWKVLTVDKIQSFTYILLGRCKSIVPCGDMKFSDAMILKIYSEQKVSPCLLVTKSQVDCIICKKISNNLHNDQLLTYTGSIWQITTYSNATYTTTTFQQFSYQMLLLVTKWVRRLKTIAKW